MKRLVFILADPRRKSGALVKEEFGYSSHPFTASDIGDSCFLGIGSLESECTLPEQLIQEELLRSVAGDLLQGSCECLMRYSSNTAAISWA